MIEALQLFLKKLNEITGKNFRLPTEAEWEYVARGGQKSKGYKYAGSNNIDEVAWYRENSNAKTNEVGLKKANEVGIYDMSGNVWEWCEDWYDRVFYENAVKNNPINKKQNIYRVLRGGGWNHNVAYCRVAFRIGDSLKFSNSGVGFRLASSL